MSGHVTVDEILTLIAIALGDSDLTICHTGDINADDHITVDEVLTGTIRALHGCLPSVLRG